MAQLSQYVLTHGALLLFILIVLEQAGLPLPSAPLLLSVGSLASSGRIDVIQALVAAVSACLIADGFWYSVGRSNRFSFHLLSTATKTTDWSKRALEIVGRHGPQALFPAKYVFSSNILSLLAGQRGTPLARFLAFDSVASFVWSGGYIALGYLLRNQIRRTFAHTLAPLALVLAVATVWSLATLVTRGSDRPRLRAQRARQNSRPLGSLPEVAHGARASELFATRPFSMLLGGGRAIRRTSLAPHLRHLGTGPFALAIALFLLTCPPSFAQQASRFLPGDSVVGVAGSNAQLTSTSGVETPPPVQSEGPTPASLDQKSGGQGSKTATLVGTVTGIDGAPISGASISLEATDSTDIRSAETNDTGFFKIAGIPSGHPYHVSVSAQGFQKWESSSIVLDAGEFKILDIDRLAIEEVQTSITVTPKGSQEIATEQVKAEEKQRGLLIIPNFYAVYSPNPEPLTAKLKFSLAFRVARDPFTFGGVTTLAGIDQAVESPRFGDGAKGYGERFAANYANAFTDVMLDGAVLPALLHQDPRYFYQGTGTKKSRTLHVISSLFVAKGDNGSRQPNYSSIGGDLASSAISNLYYPKSSRGADLVFQGFAIDTAVHLAIRLLDEFVFRPPTITPDSAPWNSNPHL